MQLIVVAYSVYIALSVALTIWVAQTLFKRGRSFLIDCFRGNTDLADSINHLLVVGFYLINFGYVTLHMRIGQGVKGPQGIVEALSSKIGVVLLVLGAVHFGNLFVFSRWRRHALMSDVAPVEPDGYLPGAVPYCAPAPQ